MAKTATIPNQSYSARRITGETPSIQSLDRGLLILETVGKSHAPVSLAELTNVLGIDRSSVFRLANTLKRRGFLAYPSTGKEYVLGTSIWRLSRQYDWSKMLAVIAHEHVRSLAKAINETTHLAIREGAQALFVDHAGTNHVVAISGQTGERIPLHCTSHGKALLADFDETSLKSLLGRQPLKSYTNQTIRSISALARTCKEIRARGYATDDCEFMEGVKCIAAPIRDRDNAVIASIGISAPVARFPKQRLPEYANRILETARQVSELIASNSE